MKGTSEKLAGRVLETIGPSSPQFPFFFFVLSFSCFFLVCVCFFFVFFFHVRAFSVQRTRLSRSLEQATFKSTETSLI